MRALSTKVLDRYLFSQMFAVVAFGVLMFTIIWLAPEKLFKWINAMFTGTASISQVGMLFLLELPATLQQSIPLAVLFSAIFLFRRFSLNGELIAMLSHGVTPRRVLLPILSVGILWAGVHALFQEAITPWSNPLKDRLSQKLGITNPKDENFTFLERDASGGIEKFLVIGQVQHYRLGGWLQDFIVLYYRPFSQSGTRLSRIVRAKYGRWNPAVGAWQLWNGVAYGMDTEGVYRDVQDFRQTWVTTSAKPNQLLRVSRVRPLDMNFFSLNKYLALLKEGGQLQDVSFYTARLYQKLTLPVASMVFAVLGALLGMERARASKHYSLTMGVFLLLVYSVTVPFSNNLAGLSLLPPWLVAWIPLLIVTGLGLVFIRFKEGLLRS